MWDLFGLAQFTNLDPRSELGIISANCDQSVSCLQLKETESILRKQSSCVDWDQMISCYQQTETDSGLRRQSSYVDWDQMISYHKQTETESALRRQNQLSGDRISSLETE
jgi:hypothetical protein